MKLSEGFNLLATAPDGIKRLRELILSLAVQGKLVPQDPSDEPASELLKQIRSEKDRLIAEGKIKKDKPLPEIGDDEKPFDLPKGWEWVRLNQLLSKIGAGSTPLGGKEVYVIEGIQFLRSQNVWNDGLHLSGVAYIRPAIHAKMAGTTVVAGDLLFNITGASIGRCAIVPSDFDEANVSQHVTIIRSALSCVTAYLHLVLISQLVQQTVMDVQVGVSREGLSIAKLGLFLIPTPPLAEQSRIVAKVEELMALCDALETRGALEAKQHTQLSATLFDALAASESAHQLQENWARLANSFDLILDRPESVDALEQTLLQLAVRGLLVEQDPNDQPASELLKQIRAEKDRLIAEGKIKKDKPLPAISDEEKPFELPQGWEWTRFPELGEFGRGKSKHRPRNDPKLFNPGIYPLIQTGEVARADKVIYEYHSKYSEIGLAQSKMWPVGTLCITIAANIADSALLGFNACFPDSVVGFVPFLPLDDAKYLQTFIETARNDLLAFAPATAQKNINLEILTSVLIPTPPLQEMKRIVARVEVLRTLCSDLRARLVASQTTQTHLSEALVDGCV